MTFGSHTIQNRQEKEIPLYQYKEGLQTRAFLVFLETHFKIIGTNLGMLQERKQKLKGSVTNKGE